MRARERRETGEYFRLQVASEVCGVTPRKVGYWIATGVLTPSMVWQRKGMRKATLVFTFEELTLLQLVVRLRDAGLPLRSIRLAVQRVREKGVAPASVLVTDGRHLYEVTKNPKVSVDVSSKHAGQTVLSAIALGPLESSLNAALNRRNIQSIPQRAAREYLRPWSSRRIG